MLQFRYIYMFSIVILPEQMESDGWGTSCNPSVRCTYNLRQYVTFYPFQYFTFQLSGHSIPNSLQLNLFKWTEETAK